MPSRAFGDVRLKHADFNFHYYSPELGYRRPIPKENYSGPYINHLPDVQVFDLTERDAYLVLATDGLWDELNRKESARICTKHEQELKVKAAANTGSNQDQNDGKLDTKKLCAVLMGNALEHAAQKNGISRDFLR